jgi:uncharacterized membrane protein
VKRRPARTPRIAGRRLTSATLSVGVALGAVCFLVAGVAELAGSTTSPAAMTDLREVAEGMARFDPWAWASLGTLIIILTPALGLAVTAAEYRVASDRSTALLALVVLAVLALSAALAILR